MVLKWKLSRSIIAAGAAALSLVLGIVDYHSGPDFSIGVLYVVPVSIAAWYGTTMGGIATSVICAASWFYCLHLQMPWEIDQHPLIVLWNFLNGLAIFLAQVYTITQLKKTLQRETTAARTDSLTGSHNSRSFRELARSIVEEMHAARTPCTLLYFDVDHFKQVNDTLGHLEGDQLLRMIASTVRANLRPGDALARLGGDEFAVLLPRADARDAEAIASRLQMELTRTAERGGWPVTFSMGMSTYHIVPDNFEAMIKETDTLMYAVKSHGKNGTRHHIHAGDAIEVREYAAPGAVRNDSLRAQPAMAR